MRTVSRLQVRRLNRRGFRVVRLQPLGVRTPRHGTVATKLAGYYGTDLPPVYTIVEEL